MIYLDAGATSLRKPKAVARAVAWAMEHCANPGRGGYREAMNAASLVFGCRERCAALFDCSPEQVVFTASATHGLNIAIKDLVGKGDRVVISGFEHNAVTRPLQAIDARVVVAGTRLFDREDTLRAFREAVTPDTKAVICTHVSNVFGYVLPVEDIADLCRSRNVPLIVDASQSAGVYPLSLRRLNAAYIAMPGHKGLLGPQGTGVLLCGRIPSCTLLEGGTGSLSREQTMPDFLPDRLEAGTCNVPGIAGLSAGISWLQEVGLGTVRSHEEALVKRAVSALRAMPRVRVFSGKRQAGVLSVQLRDMDCESAAGRLAEQGIAVRAGLQCAPLAHASAGTLAEGTVRLSVSPFTTAQEIDRVMSIISKL